MTTTTEKQTPWTPGPWSRYNDGPSSNIFLESTKNGSVCKLANNSHAEANAKLIAKAPEMAEALRNFIGAVEGHRYSMKNHSYDCPICKSIEEAERILREAGAL